MTPRLFAAAVLPTVLLVPFLAGCGGHPSSGGASSHPRARRTTPSAPTPPPAPHVAAVRRAAWRLPFPVARAAAIDAAPGSLILAGGLLTGDLSTDRVERLDLGSGSQHALQPLAVAVHDAAGGLVGGAPTVVGGGNVNEQSLVQSKVQGRWARVGDLPTTRSDLSVVDWRGHAYVLGGYDGASTPTAILRLSNRGAPHRVGRLLRGVRYAAVARLGSQAYVLGGEVAGQELDTVQRVDLATGRTHPAGHLPVPLGHAMAVAVGDRVLLMGGRVSPDRQTDALWWYDPTTRRVRPAGHLPGPLSDAAVASYGPQVWLLGGEDPGVTDRVVVVTVR